MTINPYRYRKLYREHSAENLLLLRLGKFFFILNNYLLIYTGKYTTTDIRG